MKGAILATAAAIAGTALADVAHMKRHGHDSFHQRRALEASSSADATCGCTTEVVTFYGSPTLVPVSSTPAPSSSSTVTSTAVTTLSSTSYSTVTVHVTPSTPVASSSTPEVPESSSPVAETPSSTPEAVAPSSSTPEAVAPTTTATPEAVAPSTSTTPVAVAPTTTSSVELPTNPVTSFSSTGVYTIPATTLTVTDTTTVCNANSAELPSGTHTIGGVTTVVETSTTVTCPYATVKPSGSTVTSVIETTTYVCPSAGTYTIAPITTYVPSSTVVVYPTPATFTPGTYTRAEQTVTATRTDITYVCPASSSNLPTSTPVAATTAAATTAVPATTAAPATTSVPASSASTSSVASSTPSASTGVSANRMGMTYSPYTDSGDCQSQSDVASHIKEIAARGFTHVRVYSTDCNGLEYIGQAAKDNGLKMIIGVYISSTGTSGAQEQVTAIAKWAQWDLVTLIVVGNEAIQSGYTDASSLASFISSSKSAFSAAGYTGEVTTTEPIDVWQQYSSTLCGAVDLVGANLHPFFNADTTAAEAGTFVKSEIELLEKTCSGKDVINLETGWPSNGSANGKAVPGKEEQATAIAAIAKEAGDKSVFFSYANDLWKDAGEFDVERYWGCIDSFAAN